MPSNSVIICLSEFFARHQAAIIVARTSRTSSSRVHILAQGGNVQSRRVFVRGRNEKKAANRAAFEVYAVEKPARVGELHVSGAESGSNPLQLMRTVSSWPLLLTKLS
jgi:hypothetical protein